MPANDTHVGRTTTTSVGPGDDTPVLLLTAAETSKALRLSPRKTWSLTASGELKCLRIGRSVRYDLRDLRSFIDQQKKGGAP